MTDRTIVVTKHVLMASVTLRGSRDPLPAGFQLFVFYWKGEEDDIAFACAVEAGTDLIAASDERSLSLYGECGPAPVGWTPASEGRIRRLLRQHYSNPQIEYA